MYFHKLNKIHQNSILNDVTFSKLQDTAGKYSLFSITKSCIEKVGLFDENIHPAYFEDASWTISYDVKNKEWISFHDWHPTFMLPSKRHFYTAYQMCSVKQTSLWRHNDRWDDFCKFYGTYYPFEIEYAIHTGTSVTTMRNVEYFLEAYKYSANGQDKFHVLDYNFDSAIIYNSEQISGLLNLKLNNNYSITRLTSKNINNANTNILVKCIDDNENNKISCYIIGRHIYKYNIKI